MGALGLPLLPMRTVLRALDDLAAIARAARELPARLDVLEARAGRVERQLERGIALGEVLDARGAELVALGEQIDARGEDFVAIGERIDARGGELLDVGERLDARGGEIVALGHRLDERSAALLEQSERLLEMGQLAVEQSLLVAERAREVVEQGAEVAAALPTLQRAIAIAEPLEGAVERLGRLVDRLPGGARARVEGDPAP